MCLPEPWYPLQKMQSNIGLTESRNGAKYTVDRRGSQEIFLEKTVICAGNEEPGKRRGWQRGRRVSGRGNDAPLFLSLLLPPPWSRQHPLPPASLQGASHCPLDPFPSAVPTGVIGNHPFKTDRRRGERGHKSNLSL